MDGPNWNDEQQNNTYYYQSQDPVQMNMGNMGEDKQADGLAIASLICGILSIVSCCCCMLGLMLGIAAILCAVLSQRRRSTGMAIAGLVCGIIGCVLSAVVMIFMLVFCLDGGMSGYEVQDFYRRHTW